MAVESADNRARWRRQWLLREPSPHPRRGAV